MLNRMAELHSRLHMDDKPQGCNAAQCCIGCKLAHRPIVTAASPHRKDAAYRCSILVSDKVSRQESGMKPGTGSDRVTGVQAMVRDHAGDSRWGAHAHAIAHGSMWKPPGNGGRDDKVCLLPLVTISHDHKRCAANRQYVLTLDQHVRQALTHTNLPIMHVGCGAMATSTLQHCQRRQEAEAQVNL